MDIEKLKRYYEIEWVFDSTLQKLLNAGKITQANYDYITFKEEETEQGE